MENKETRGQKRMRAPRDSSDDLSGKLAGKLHHGLREARKGAKKAKAFEMQKLVKKLKGLQSDVDERRQLESLLKELKSTDHERLGTFALFSKLRKDKVLSRNLQFSAVMEAEQSALAHSGSTLVSALETRLLSSKALSGEVNSVISSLRSIISPAPEGELDIASGRHAKVPRGQDKLVALSKTPAAWESGVSSGPDHEKEAEDEEAHLGGSSEGMAVIAHNDWESGTVDEEDDVEESDSEKSESSSDPDGTLNAVNPTNLSSAQTGHSRSPTSMKASESVFLPSLAVGFTRGDSDSEFSDKEAAAADGVRKNRRGQRARRAIWEKKYGNGAKHLKKAESDRQTTTRSGDRTPHGRPQHDSQQRHGQQTGAKARFVRRPIEEPKRTSFSAESQRPPKRSVARDDKPLHPSWEAKKRLKEQQNASIRPPMGTRITFDD